MGYVWSQRDRPGTVKIMSGLSGKRGTISPGGGGGGGSETAVGLYMDETVLASKGAAPTMESTTLVYTPTPVMDGNILTIS